VTASWRDRTLEELLAEHGLAGVPEEPFPTDGWSGARFSYLRSIDGAGFVLKRGSPAHDWLARALLDTQFREAEFVDRAVRQHLPFLSVMFGPLVLPYLGAAVDGDESVILMPDLSTDLLAWERPGHSRAIDPSVIERVIEVIARLHTLAWWTASGDEAELPWCPLRERITLLTPASAERYRAEGNPVGEIFLAGWEAFDRHASTEARALIGRLTADPDPLIDALARLPVVGLHGDLKLSNVAVSDDGRVGIIDWQMVMKGPVAVELGWLLVSNVAVLPHEPELVLADYFDAVRRATPGDDDIVGDRSTTTDLALIVGLLLRGWRKGLDAEAGATLASGVAATEDLSWWCARAADAAARHL